MFHFLKMKLYKNLVISIPNTIIKMSAITADKLKILYHLCNNCDEINLFTNNNITIKSIAIQPFKIDK